MCAPPAKRKLAFEEKVPPAQYGASEGAGSRFTSNEEGTVHTYANTKAEEAEGACGVPTWPMLVILSTLGAKRDER